MPRPRKCRRVCCLPETMEFVPADGSSAGAPVSLTVDEYETIRLIDREGLSQEACGVQMEVARTTVQQIYTLARRKIADALVEGRTLRIEGGEYRLCDENPGFCGCGQCHRRQARMQQEQNQQEETK